MIWVTTALAQQIELGAGRIAVLDPGFAPAAVSTSHSTVVDVEASPPVLLLMALKAGTSTVTVERADGSAATWEVKVDPDNVAPTGGPGLQPPGDSLAVPVGESAVCTIPTSTAFVHLDDPALKVSEFGSGRWLIGVEGPVHADVVFPVAKGKPKVVSVVSGSGPTGPACLKATERVQVAVGQTATVAVGKPIEAWNVERPAIAYATVPDDPPTAIRVQGVRAGTTTLVVRGAGSDPPLLRTIEVVAAAP